ncbi:MAG: hypothetical protein HY735_05550 [Verrucomicrobia bacterium]|nr:hypothetical protein [Verrucomicrobiota bacterium]
MSQSPRSSPHLQPSATSAVTPLTLEPDFEKVVLNVDEQHGRVTHAARQLPDGRWTSKLGPQWDINHLLEGLCGPRPAYGDVAQILRRPAPKPEAGS